MKAVTIKCPQCGATLNAAESDEWVTCAYCSTRSHVEPSTELLESPLPQLSDLDGVPRPPVATRKATGKVHTVGVIVVLVVAAGVIGGIWYGVRADQRTQEQRYWNCPRGILLVDVNGDGVPDPVGNTFQIKSGGREALVAVDGAKGTRLWTAAPIPGLGGTALNVVAGDKLLLADDAGSLHALSARDGTFSWTAKLGERAKDFCLADAATVVVTTADEQRHSFRLADGSPTDPPAEAAPCAVLATDSTSINEGLVLRGATELRVVPPGEGGVGEAPGMSFIYAVERPADGLRLVLGAKTPGTPSPMLALLAPDRTVRWTVVLPADPMSAPPGAVDIEDLAWVGDRAFVAYERMAGETRGSAVVAVDLVSGRRLWETAIPDDGPLSSLVGVPGHLFVGTWSMVAALDPETGAIVWQRKTFE
jgi:DNA-directed RNA polymerase subunit RPC12/RpoP